MRDDTPANWVVYLFFGFLAYVVLGAFWTLIPIWWSDWF